MVLSQHKTRSGLTASTRRRVRVRTSRRLLQSTARHGAPASARLLASSTRHDQRRNPLSCIPLNHRPPWHPHSLSTHPTSISSPHHPRTLTRCSRCPTFSSSRRRRSKIIIPRSCTLMPPRRRGVACVQVRTLRPSMSLLVSANRETTVRPPSAVPSPTNHRTQLSCLGGQAS